MTEYGDKNLRSAVEHLLEKQSPEGFWNAHLETNCCMEAQWIMASIFCDIECEKNGEIAEYIVNMQRGDGSWEVYRDAANGDVNTTLECYFALRLLGHSPDSPVMKKAREWLLANEWYRHVRVFTKYWLALFGEWPWSETPALPPEIIYFPKWFPFNIYKFAAWARATIMPLCIVSSRRPVKRLPQELRIDELFPHGRNYGEYSVGKTKKIPRLSLKGFFLAADKVFHFYNEKSSNSALRRRAIADAMRWILSHQDDDGFWGGIQPPWIYGIIAMKIENFPMTEEHMARAVNAVNLHWTELTPHGRRVKASESPVWDTMLALIALLDAGMGADSSAVSMAAEYLLSKENNHYGDWAQTVGTSVEPSGWSFQRENKFYPDIDDTGVAIMALKKFARTLPPGDARAGRIEAAIARGAKWLVSMQSKNGGWGAFDRDNTTSLVTHIPFCDFGEVLDPPSVDVTGHVVEALAGIGYSPDDPVVERGVNFILSEQEEDGSWFGRWGVNYIYGTWCALTALAACGFTASNPRVKAALKYLADRQNPDGGWGESATTYMQNDCASPSTASQTAWAVLAISAFKSEYAPAALRGIEFLKRTQSADGTWDESAFTGTGFPGYGLGAKVDVRKGAALPQGAELSRGFMLRYGYYCLYFPIMALSRERILRDEEYARENTECGVRADA